MPRHYFVYILSNQARCYYVGVTNNLYRRWSEHRSGSGSAFCRANHITRLVYAEVHTTPLAAITREKHLKKLPRHRKLKLIRALNPGVVDLAVKWGWREPPDSAKVLGESAQVP